MHTSCPADKSRSAAYSCTVHTSRRCPQTRSIQLYQMSRLQLHSILLGKLQIQQANNNTIF